MYLLKGDQILKKSDYNGLITHCRDWRKEGLIDWDDIIDGSGRGVINDFSDYKNIPTFVDDHVDYLQNAGYYYNRLLNGEWRWIGQPNYIEIWCEKHAIAGMIAMITKSRYVRIAFNKGNPGWGYMHDNYTRLENEMYSNLQFLSKRKNIYIWYLGDWDKHGRHMDFEIENQLRYFGLWDRINFKRIALLPAQIQSYKLPENFEGEKGYEVDALNARNPEAFKELILSHIDAYFDERIHKKILNQHPAKDIDNLVRTHVKFVSEMEPRNE